MVVSVAVVIIKVKKKEVWEPIIERLDHIGGSVRPAGVPGRCTKRQSTLYTLLLLFNRHFLKSCADLARELHERLAKNAYYKTCNFGSEHRTKTNPIFRKINVSPSTSLARSLGSYE